ncbi:MAG TPA: FAD-dependent oxidoreductase [Xanthobacteraceae bacterium]|jgi:3-phenylpropionate/trans-cinnamate dioxygenase ferredoxin reductase subunit|nr:FAD-dependent oxidoreductase [Xanthobacteraceae bacterium]
MANAESDASGTANVVVIGAGQAAAQLAISLRSGGFAGPIIVIGDEPFLPYQRPPLSKKFLAEGPPAESLYLRPAPFWAERGIDFQLGVAAAEVDLRGRSVSLADGREIAFHNLVFATGTCARRLPLPGLDRDGVFTLRAIGDVKRLRPALDTARRIVILGGGYIGLETASVMRGEQRDVIVLEAEDRVLKRVTAPAIASFFDGIHRERGVDIRTGARVAAIGGEGRALVLRLTDGADVEADAVLLAAGAKANDELAAAAGLACREGILTDAVGRTSVERVFAIGDCARFPSARYGREIRLECVQNAIDQAKATAAAILGAPASYDPVPWFWSDQYEFKLQIAGLFDGHDETAPTADPASARFSIEYRKDGRLIAVDSVNDARAHMLARRRIAEETKAAAELGVA